MNKVIQKAQIRIWVWLLALLVVLPFVIPKFWTLVIAEILAFAIFALGYNIIMGFGGMVSFGHAGFYGVGAYVVAILLTKTAVPLWAAIAMAPLFASLIGLIVGLLSVGRRAFYFAIITLAFAQLIWSVIFKWYNFTGGENGIINLQLSSYVIKGHNMYFLILAITAASAYAIRRIVDSPFGRVMLAMRENTQRVEFMGVNIYRQRLIAFVISTFFAGLSAAMHVLIIRGAFPDLVSWEKSGEVLIACMLGGMHTFFGPAVGVAMLFSLHTFVGGLTVYWPFILGVIFILVVLFVPRGIVGYLQESNLFGRFIRRER